MNQAQASAPQDQNWTPAYSSWRHGGWYVYNLRYPNGACGCVSNNYPDGKWRVVCDKRRGSLGQEGDFTFPTRDATAHAEYEIVQQLFAELALEQVLQEAIGFTRWDGSPFKGSLLPDGVTEATQVEVIFRNGQRHTGCAQSFGWQHSGYHPFAQIVAYRMMAAE